MQQTHRVYAKSKMENSEVLYNTSPIQTSLGVGVTRAEEYMAVEATTTTTILQCTKGNSQTITLHKIYTIKLYHLKILLL